MNGALETSNASERATYRNVDFPGSIGIGSKPLKVGFEACEKRD